jgi:RNA polymerase sigma factor (TIGR02999 family)
MRSCLIHLGDEIRCGSNSKLARTLPLMGDAEKTLKSAHGNCAQLSLVFNKFPIVTLTLNCGTPYPAGNFVSMVDIEVSVEIGFEGLGVVQLPSQRVTELLVKWRGGDQEALHALLPLVYKELRDIAHRQLRHERSGHTLQSTALVHEAYLRLMDQGAPETQNRAHFVAVAARLMRQILIDYARSRGAQKRGANLRVDTEPREGAVAARGQQGVDVVALDEALNALSQRDEQQSRIVEMGYFGGLTIDETAEVLRISPATVKRDWNMAKAWLSREMRRGARGEAGAT